MQSIGFIICNSGDGSNHLEWFYPTLTEEQLQEIEESDYERYSSGDGIQYQELEFPDSFDMQFFIKLNLYSTSTFEEWKKEREEY